MPIKIDNSGVTSTGGDTITVDDNLISNGYFRIGDAAESASVAGAGALKYTSRILLSNGTDWLPIYIERDGSNTKPIYFLSDVADVYSSDQTLYVNPHNEGDTVQYTVDFSTPSAPKYQTSRTSADNSPGGVAGVGGECVSTSGTVGGCSEGTGSAYDVFSAASYCMKAGMRLCTRAEIKVGAAMGSGCAHDNRAIWTSTTDGNGNYYMVEGDWHTGNQNESLQNGTSFTVSGFSTNEIGIRCCNPISGVDLWEI